jgi:hypothetical protein
VLRLRVISFAFGEEIAEGAIFVDFLPVSRLPISPSPIYEGSRE